MRIRVTIAMSAAALLVLTGCNSGDDDPTPGDPSPSSSASATTATPTPTSATTTPETAADLVGDWHDTDADWVVHFHDDGTFTEDYTGVKDFRTGEYEVASGTVTLKGGDGNADEGKIEGTSIVFRLGTLTRM